MHAEPFHVIGIGNSCIVFLMLPTLRQFVTMRRSSEFPAFSHDFPIEIPKNRRLGPSSARPPLEQLVLNPALWSRPDARRPKVRKGWNVTMAHWDFDGIS